MEPARKWWRMVGLFFFQAEDGIRDVAVTGVQTCALPISSGSSDTGAVARAGRTSTGTWAGEQAAQNIATTTEPSRVSVRTVSFCARRRGRWARAAGIAGPRGTRPLPRRGWAPSGDAGSVAGGRERIPHVMSSHRFADWEAAPGWVVQRAGGQHGDEDVEQAVHDATYRARMTMPAGAQTFVVRATDRIMAGGGPGPTGTPPAPPPGGPRT